MTYTTYMVCVWYIKFLIVVKCVFFPVLSCYLLYLEVLTIVHQHGRQFTEETRIVFCTSPDPIEAKTRTWLDTF